MSIIYREMDLEDAPQVYSIDQSCFTNNWSLDSYEKEMKNGLATYIVAEDAGQIVGFGGYWLIIDEAQITNIAVLEAYRNLGIGQAVFNEMLMGSELRGSIKMTLEVREDNFSAISFYQKNRFKKEGMRFHYYGKNQHALIMGRDYFED